MEDKDKDKDPKWKIKLRVLLWGVFFWWQETFANKKFPSASSLLDKLSQKVTIHNIDWYKMVMYPIIVTTGTIVSAIILASVVGFCALFVTGTRNDLTNEENQRVAPAAIVVESAGENRTQWWEAQVSDWLTSSESVHLREQVNAHNLIILHQDQVRIAANMTLYIDESWVQKKPYFVEAILLDGTAVTVQIGGRQYNINTYMPFVWQSAPEQIVIVDGQGTLWTIFSSDIQLQEIGSRDLPIHVNANEKLEIAFSKQQ